MAQNVQTTIAEIAEGLGIQTKLSSGFKMSAGVISGHIVEHCIKSVEGFAHKDAHSRTVKAISPTLKTISDLINNNGLILPDKAYRLGTALYKAAQCTTTRSLHSGCQKALRQIAETQGGTEHAKKNLAFMAP